MVAAEGPKRIARGEGFKVPVHDAQAPRSSSKNGWSPEAR